VVTLALPNSRPGTLVLSVALAGVDAVERGETVTIVRGNRPVAEIAPAYPRTGAGLPAALADTAPPDEEFSRHIAEAVALLRSEVSDAWADA
jgi:antitoxin (DNA-binding transcriptional repressor) of toxin-antitoxin stability system